VRLPALPDAMKLDGPWALSVRTTGPDGDGKVDVKLDKLADWRDIPELSSASGTGTYTGTFDVPGSWLGDGRGVLLDPGAIGGFLELRINGRPAPVASLADGPLDVTPLLEPGDNEITATVATTVTNVIVDHAQRGDTRYTLFAK